MHPPFYQNKLFQSLLIFQFSELYTSTKNISEVAKELGLNILLDLVTTAGLAKTLSTGGPFTLFAPTDDAFKALGKDVVEKLKTDPKTLSKILLFHITTGKVLSTALKDDTKIETLNAPNKVRVNIFSRGRVREMFELSFMLCDVICTTDNVFPVVKLSDSAPHEHGNKLSSIKLKVFLKLLSIC